MASLVIFMLCGLGQLVIRSYGMMSLVSNVTGMAMDMSVTEFQDASIRGSYDTTVFMGANSSCNFTSMTDGCPAVNVVSTTHVTRANTFCNFW